MFIDIVFDPVVQKFKTLQLFHMEYAENYKFEI